jgi:hypothetical protein
MDEYKRLDNCKYLVVDSLFEPSQNRLAIQVTVGAAADMAETVQVSGREIGPVRKIDFDTSETYSISFGTYISYFVVNESYDRGMVGEFSGNRIRRYSKSTFIDFCKQQNIYFKLWDDSDIIHFGIVTSNHLIHVLTTSEPEITKIG